MSKIIHFTVPKQVAVQLPMHLIARTNGYMSQFSPETGWDNENGPRFCTMGHHYKLTEVRDLDNPDGPEFVVLTDSYDDEDRQYLSPHYMDYEFLSRYFHVTF